MAVLLGINVGKRTHSAVAVDQTGAELGARHLRATHAGYRQLVRWAHLRWPDTELTFAVEGCGQASSGLEWALLTVGERVVRVPPKSVAAPRAPARRRGDSDPVDALAIARAALAEPDLPLVTRDAVPGSNGGSLAPGCLGSCVLVLAGWPFLFGAISLLGALVHLDDLPFSVPVAAVITVVALGLMELAIRLVGRRRWMRLSKALDPADRAAESLYGADAVPVRYGLMELAALPFFLLVPVLVVLTVLPDGLENTAAYPAIFAGLLPLCSGYLGRYLMTATAAPCWLLAAGLLLSGQRRAGEILMALVAITGWTILGAWMYRRRRHGGRAASGS